MESSLASVIIRRAVLLHGKQRSKGVRKTGRGVRGARRKSFFSWVVYEFIGADKAQKEANENEGSRRRIKKGCPTNNAPLTNFLLSSDAKFLLIITD